MDTSSGGSRGISLIKLGISLMLQKNEITIFQGELLASTNLSIKWIDEIHNNFDSKIIYLLI